MTAFIYLILFFISLEIIAKLTILGSGVMPKRTPGLIAWDTAANVVLLVLGILALRSGT